MRQHVPNTCNRRCHSAFNQNEKSTAVVPLEPAIHLPCSRVFQRQCQGFAYALVRTSTFLVGNRHDGTDPFFLVVFVEGALNLQRQQNH